MPSTAADASAVAAVLRDPHSCGCPPEQVTRLAAAAASRAGVRAGLDGPAEQAGEAEQAAKRAESAVAEATKPRPDKDDVEYSLARLTKAA